VLDALASIGGNPAAMSAGKVRKEPPPAIALMKPAAKAARVTMTEIITPLSFLVFFHASPVEPRGKYQAAA
jgi:hypothetical protein